MGCLGGWFTYQNLQILDFLIQSGVMLASDLCTPSLV